MYFFKLYFVILPDLSISRHWQNNKIGKLEIGCCEVVLKVEANISEQEAVNNLWLVGEPKMTGNGSNVKMEFNEKTWIS